MVRARGLEPPRPCGHQHLKLAWLPITARAHMIYYIIKILFDEYFKILFKKLGFRLSIKLDITRVDKLLYLGYGRLAQLARAPRLHRGGRGFEPLSAHQLKI